MASCALSYRTRYALDILDGKEAVGSSVRERQAMSASLVGRGGMVSIRYVIWLDKLRLL